MKIDTSDSDAADTLRFRRTDLDISIDPDATSIYDLGSLPPLPPRYIGRSSSACRRLIRATRHDIAGLRAAIDDGWDVAPELAHEQRRLAALETADRRGV
jgi:hypothetical protein